MRSRDCISRVSLLFEVVVAGQMKDAVHQEEGYFLGVEAAFLLGLTPGLGAGDYHLSQGRGLAGGKDESIKGKRVAGGRVVRALPVSGKLGGKGEDVGGLVEAPVTEVQAADVVVTGEQHADLSRGNVRQGGIQGALEHAAGPFVGQIYPKG